MISMSLQVGFSNVSVVLIRVWGQDFDQFGVRGRRDFEGVPCLRPCWRFHGTLQPGMEMNLPKP